VKRSCLWACLLFWLVYLLFFDFFQTLIRVERWVELDDHGQPWIVFSDLEDRILGGLVDFKNNFDDSELINGGISASNWLIRLFSWQAPATVLNQKALLHFNFVFLFKFGAKLI